MTEIDIDFLLPFIELDVIYAAEVHDSMWQEVVKAGDEDALRDFCRSWGEPDTYTLERFHLWGQDGGDVRIEAHHRAIACFTRSCVMRMLGIVGPNGFFKSQQEAYKQARQIVDDYNLPWSDHFHYLMCTDACLYWSFEDFKRLQTALIEWPFFADAVRDCPSILSELTDGSSDEYLRWNTRGYYPKPTVVGQQSDLRGGQTMT